MRIRLPKDKTASTPTSPEFKAWFGDSKVVDAQGHPRVVYHSTDKSFTVFDSAKTQDAAFWFTSDKAAAESGEVGAAGHGVVLAVYLSIQHPAGWEEYDKYMLDELVSKGYDGVILPDAGEITYIVFNPTQIKAVDASAFDPKNSDITAIKAGLNLLCIKTANCYINVQQLHKEC
jgi:hypothetical protein